MLSFFDRPEMNWASLKGKLHIYVIPPPGSPALVQFERMASAFIGHKGLGHQTARHMHVTLVSFDAFCKDLSEPVWDGIRAELRERLARIQSFTFSFDEPTIRADAIEACGSPRESWDFLLSQIRSVFCDHGLDEIVCPPSYGPHYTLAYARKPTKDSMIIPVLKRSARRIEFDVGEVALVAVDQDPSAGVFEFRTIDTYGLGERGRGEPQF